jgi:hypothetical protein
MAFDFLLVCAPLLRGPPERRDRHKVHLNRPTCLVPQRNQAAAAQLNRVLNQRIQRAFLNRWEY